MSDCCVCLEKPSYPITLSCGHTFCYICIKFVCENSKTCPLCRAPVSESLDKLSIDDISNHDQIVETYPCVKWLFKSRDNKSWWYYDPNVNNELEFEYQRILSSNKPDTNNNDVVINANHDGNSDDSDSDCDDTEQTNQFKINVGPHEYSIDFVNMKQIGNLRTRNIMRKEFNSQSEKNMFDKSIRGIVGIYFEKK